MDFPIELFDDLIAVQYDSEVHSDIALPDWKRSLIGTVVAVGPGERLPDGVIAPMQVCLGDRVSFGAAIGMEASLGTKYPIRIMKDRDVDFVITR